jgi:hypothetical protein
MSSSAIVPYNATLEEASDALYGKPDWTYLMFKVPDVASTFEVIHLGVIGGAKNHFIPIRKRVSLQRRIIIFCYKELVKTVITT